MKKRAAGLLAAGLVLGSCWTANAAGHNPYADVPKKDWSYGAVESLIQQGLVTGMTVEDYHNLKRRTRNDLAIYIAQAVSQRENANAHNRDLIYRLVKDYAYELHAIGVDDEFVPEPPQEKKEEQDTRPEIYKKLDRLTLQGWAYIRQNHYESSGASMGRQRTMTHLSENGIDVSPGYTYKLNDNWSFIGSADFYRKLHHEDTTANLNMKSMYLLGHMHGYDIRAGHYDPSNGLGMVFSDSIDGAEVQWGNRWRSTLSIGHVAADDPHKAGADTTGSSYAGWESLDYSTPRTNLPWYLTDSATGYSTLAQIRAGQKVVVVQSDTVKVVDANSDDAKNGQVIGVDKLLSGTEEYAGLDANGRWGDDAMYEKRSRPDVLSYRVHGMMGHGTWGGLGVYYLTRGNVELYQDPQRHALYYGFFAGSHLSRKVSTTVQASYGKNTALPNRSCPGGGSMNRRLAYSFRYQYGNSSIDKPGSWSLFALYQYYPRLASYAGTSDDWHKNEKGLRLGGEYTFDKGFLLNYYGQWTHDLDTHGFAREFRAQMNWVF